MPQKKIRCPDLFQEHVFVFLRRTEGRLSARIISLVLPVHPRFRQLFHVVVADVSHSKGSIFKSTCYPPKDCLEFFKEMVLHPKEKAQMYCFSLTRVIPV